MNLQIKWSAFRFIFTNFFRPKFPMTPCLSALNPLRGIQFLETPLAKYLLENLLILRGYQNKILDEHILQVSTYRRKRTKRKREKRKQRRKKMRRLSWKKKEHKNY